jgi:hypothetical protein
MQIKPEAQTDYDKGLANNQDPYGNRCYTYAEEWANLLEKQIAESPSDQSPEAVIAKYAKPLSHLADTDGITGYMYGVAVSILAHCWIHGELLRRWHNLDTQIGNEGEKANAEGGTLNPALLSIG